MGGIWKMITSPVFSLEASDKVAWRLIACPNGIDEESKDYLSVFLVLHSCPESSVWAKFKFWIINSKGEKYQCMKSPKVVRFLGQQYKGFNKFLRRDRLLSHRDLLLPKDKFTICCQLSKVGSSFSMPGQNMTPVIKKPRHIITDDLGELWKNSLFTDCCLIVGGHEFRAHKAILAARSPVFRAMFEQDMKESITNSVEIQDLDPQVFKEMMGFIYTGKAPHLHSYFMATGVLAAADKYGLEGLKVLCEDALQESVCRERCTYSHLG